MSLTRSGNLDTVCDNTFLAGSDVQSGQGSPMRGTLLCTIPSHPFLQRTNQPRSLVPGPAEPSWWSFILDASFGFYAQSKLYSPP